MDIYVKEYAWMWQRLGLSLAECRVFAYIYGLTNSTKTKQKGYKGGIRELAKTLGMDSGYVSRILRQLQERNLIHSDNDLYTSATIDNTSATIDNTSATIDNTSATIDNKSATIDNKSATIDNTSATIDNKSATIDNKSATIDNTPRSPLLKEINKEMENNNKLACETLATPSPRTLSSFEELLNAYRCANGKQQLHPETIRDARCIWDAMPRYKQRALINALNTGTWNKPRLDWALSDFPDPQPTNYNGRAFPAGQQMVIAIHNGKGGVYTRQEAEIFEMKIKKVLTDK